MSSPGAEDIVQRLLASWNARDLDAFVNCLTADVEWYDPAMPDPPARGRAAVKAFAEAVIRAFPDFAYEIVPPICVAADGTRCAVKWRVTGSHVRPLDPLGYAPTGRRVDIEGVDVLDLKDGQVECILTAFDVLPAAEQLLGMRLRPSPGTWRAWLAVRAQQFLAWRTRSKGRRPTRG